MKHYRVWTKSGNWNFVATEDCLKELKKAYRNFYYQLVGSNKVVAYKAQVK